MAEAVLNNPRADVESRSDRHGESEEIPWQKEVRRLRKKLMQIEHLKNLKRTLTEEEIAKLKKVDRYREALMNYLEKSDTSTVETKPAPNPADVQWTESASGSSWPISADSASLTFAPNQDLCCSTPRYSAKEGSLPEMPSAPPYGVQLVGGGESEYDGPRAEFETEDISMFEHPGAAAVSGTEFSDTISLGGADARSGKKVDFKRKKAFAVRSLEGHSDLVLSVDFDDDVLISAGRDTTARVWDVATGSEINSLRGHQGAVTGVVILPFVSSTQMCQMLAVPDQKLCLTASLDCHVKLWLLGEVYEAIRSVYTFCGITSLQCWYGTEFPEAFAVVGNEGGKIEVYDMISRQLVVATHPFDDQVSSMIVDQKTNRLYASSWNGKLCIWELVHVLGSNCGPRVQLKPIYDSDVICTLQRKIIRPDMLKGIAPTVFVNPGSEEKSVLLYVDKGPTLKALDWEKSLVTKFKNQRGDFCISDAIYCADDCVFSSSFNLESGHGCVHVRDSRTMEYVCSVADGESGRILGIQARSVGVVIDPAKAVEVYRLCTFGAELKVWDWFNPRDRKVLKHMSKWSDSIIYPETLDALSSVVEDSDDDSLSEEFLSSEDDEPEDEDNMTQSDSSTCASSRGGAHRGSSNTDDDSHLAEQTSYWRWCNIS